MDLKTKFSRRRLPSFLSALLCIALLLTQSGCLTCAMWYGVTETHMSYPSVKTVSADVKSPTGPSRLVANYTLSQARGLDSKHIKVVIPVDDAGVPIWPLVVEGSPTTREEILAAVSGRQAKALRHFKFTSADFRAVKRVNTFTPDDTIEGRSYMLSIPQLNCAAYALDNDGRLVPVLERKLPDAPADLYSTEGWVFPPGMRIVLIPNEQPRPAGDLGGAIIGDTLLTPFTLIIDGVLTPLFFIGVLVTGSFPC